MYQLTDAERDLLAEIWKQADEMWVGPKYRQFCADHSEQVETIRQLQAKELAINTAISNEMRLVVKSEGFFYLPAELTSSHISWAEKLLNALRTLHKKNPDARFKILDLCGETGLDKGQVFRGLTLLSRMGLPHSGVLKPSKDVSESWIQPTEDIFTIKSFTQLHDRRKREHEDRAAQLQRIQANAPPIQLPGIPSSAPPQKRVILAECDRCGGKRNHSVLAELKEHQEADDPESDIAFADLEWQIIRCSGCNETRFREHILTSKDYLPGVDSPQGVEKLFPIPQKRKPVPFAGAPDQIHDLYTQAVSAFNEDMRHLCAAGLRALVEAICAERGIMDGKVLDDQTLSPKLNKRGDEYRSDSLEGRIWGLAEKGLLTTAEAAMLHKHRYLGNDALHQALAPTRESLEGALDVIEHMLEKFYELPSKAAKIKRATP